MQNGIFLAVLILLPIAETGSRSGHVTCPPTCYCQPSARIVQCARRGLVSIPETVPETTRQINLNGNHFRFGYVGRANFSRYPGLRRQADKDGGNDGSSLHHGVEQLYMSDCAIRYIEHGAFSDLVDLRWLDLSDNLLETITDSTFTGSNLEQLFLNGNRRLILVPTSFAGLSTSGLYLHDCGLERLDAAVLSPLVGSLRTLWLQKNRIERLDPELSHVIESLTDFRFVPNPYYCDCRLTWFKRFFDRRRLHLSHDAKSNIRETLLYSNGLDAIPVCFGPPSLSGRSFTNLTLYDFHCRMPVFGDIEADFDGHSGRLLCTAHGEPQPEVRWIRWPTAAAAASQSTVAATAVTEVMHVAKIDGVSVAAAELILSGQRQPDKNDVIMTRQMLDAIFSCIASNAAGNITLTVSLQSASKASSPSMMPTTSGFFNSTIISTISSNRSDSGEYGDHRRHVLDNNNNAAAPRRSKSTFGRNDVIVERDTAEDMAAIEYRSMARFPSKVTITDLPRPEVKRRSYRRFVFGELMLAVSVTAVVTMTTVLLVTWLVLLTISCVQRRRQRLMTDHQMDKASDERQRSEEQ